MVCEGQKAISHVCLPHPCSVAVLSGGSAAPPTAFFFISSLLPYPSSLAPPPQADQLLAPNFSEDMNHIHQHCGKRLPPKEGSAPAADASASSSGSDSSSARGREVGKPSESSSGSGGNGSGSSGASSNSSGNGSSSGGAAAAVEGVVGRGAPVVPLARQTVLVSATLSQSVLSRIKEWCPSPRFISQRSARTPALPAADAAAGRAAAAAPMPAWGWGIRGWDGPANELGPRTSGSAGGVEGEEGLVPTLPPHLRHLYVVVEQRHKADALRRCIHAMEVQRTLVFMNYQQRLRDTMFKLSARKIKVRFVLNGECRDNLLGEGGGESIRHCHLLHLLESTEDRDVWAGCGGRCSCEPPAAAEGYHVEAVCAQDKGMCVGCNGEEERNGWRGRGGWEVSAYMPWRCSARWCP